jgi:hypothetical protein
MADFRVTFVDIDVHKDGDGVFNGKGDLYWALKVDGVAVSTRSVGNPRKTGAGESIDLQDESMTVTKSGSQNLVVSGSVSDRDPGADETASFTHNYTSVDSWGSTAPHAARLTDGKLDVTVNYTITRL